MTTKEITFIFVFSVLLVKAQSDLEGCWKKESNTISFVTPTSPQLVSSSEAYFYLYANTPTSLNLQSGNEVWEISPASVDYTKNYSVVRKLNLKGEFTPYLFHSIYDLRSGGYFITNSNLRNGSRSSPDLTQGFTNPKVEAYGVPDTTNSFFLVQRNSASGDAMLVSEVSLKSELPNVIKSFGVKYDATSFDIYAEVFESSLTGATTKTMYILANNNGKMSIELFSYSKLTPDQHISATLGYEAQNDFKILGSDNTQLFFAIKNFKTTFVDILSVPKNAIVSGAIVQPKLIVSLASSSSTIEVSDIRKDNTVTIALNNNAKGNAIDVVNINLTTSERIQLPSIPTLSATQPYALDVSKKGITRIALMIKGNSFDIYKFVVAPSLPKPVVDKVFAVDTARKLDVPMVNRRNYYTHCGAFTYEQYAKVAFKNLPPDVDTLITGRSTSISKDDAPNMFSANRFQIYNGSFITDFSFQYRNACWRSDTVNIKMVSQVFNLTENGALATAYCENTSSALNIPTSLVWPNVLFNYPTIMEPDTFIVTSMSTPPSTTKYAGALNVSQIPYTADVSSLSFNIRKLATSILGCSSSS
ncbi:MAG TPA: hypothetical protein VL947_05205, partial [Cytophagales bacterium]|nr:hypothetical protein [Cytophagales bacterium]